MSVQVRDPWDGPLSAGGGGRVLPCGPVRPPRRNINSSRTNRQTLATREDKGGGPLRREQEKWHEKEGFSSGFTPPPLFSAGREGALDGQAGEGGLQRSLALATVPDERPTASGPASQEAGKEVRVELTKAPIKGAGGVPKQRNPGAAFLSSRDGGYHRNANQCPGSRTTKPETKNKNKKPDLAGALCLPFRRQQLQCQFAGRGAPQR